MHTRHPTAGDVFYLRLLLHNEHSRGKNSFADVKVLPNGVAMPSYKDVCRHLGLLQDDGEWHAALDDAAVRSMPSQLRSIYVMILEFCNPADPIALFNDHWTQMADDFQRAHCDATNDQLAPCHGHVAH